MAVAWIVGGGALGSLLAALLAFLAIAQARVWRANRQVYLRPPDLSPAQVRWANEKRLSDDPEATLIIPAGHPDYIRPVDWQALRARGRPWPFRTGGGPGGLPTPHDARSVGRRCRPPHE
jgi:hypothetical protein